MIDLYEIDRFYLREAYRYARDYSEDPNTQNGAVLVSDNATANLDNIVVWGVNRLPEGFNREIEILNDKAKKLLYIRHAERDALYSALKLGHNTKKLIMYCPWSICDNCADPVTAFGLKELIGHTGPDKFYEEINKVAIEKGEKKSGWTDSIKAGFARLEKAGIPYRFVDGKIGDVKIRFAGREFEP
jgi:deoxycytidylate deaminase